jgi:hypothetical protein
MGMIRDMTQRVTMARIDNDQCQNKVKIARTLIYQKGRAVNSVPVEDLLKETSLVPNTVWVYISVSDVILS